MLQIICFQSCCHSNRNVFSIEAKNSARHSPPEIIPSSFENLNSSVFIISIQIFEVLTERENDIENNICCKKLHVLYLL